MPLKIEQMFAFIATDEKGDEGVCGFKGGDGWIPMVGADMAMVDKLRPIARMTAISTKTPIKLCVFTKREEVEEIGY